VIQGNPVELNYIAADALEGHGTPLLVIPVVEGPEGPILPDLPAWLASRLGDGLWRTDLNGKLGKLIRVYPTGDGGFQRALMLGAGKREELDLESIRRYVGHAVRYAESKMISAATIWIPEVEDTEADVQAAAESALISAWRFTELKAPGDDPPGEVDTITLTGVGDAGSAASGLEAGRAVGNGSNFARALQFRPGNVATPSHLAAQATEMAESRGLDITVLGPAEMLEEGMQALLAVAQGSDEEPRFIVLRHNGGTEGDAPLVLVGKGLTFDSGGISLKPPAGMEEMKFDMSGGAAVLGAMQAIADLAVPLNVVGVVPSSENLMNGSAVKPGDIIGSREGKTIEVVNTDAEGRLILADALSYAQSLEPAAVVDCATLTGSVVVALGHHCAAVMGSDDDLVGELKAAGDRSGERCWHLPLWKEYRRQLDSDVADIVNVGGRPGGSITAACFLQEFVGEMNWAHLDIAGTAYGEGKLPYQRKGGYGFPSRLLVQWVRSRAG
jgi:leucyl aminopeptidase